MSAYSTALRNLAEMLEAHPEWDHETFHADGATLSIFPQDNARADEIAATIGGDWAPEPFENPRWIESKDNILGFEEVCIYLVVLV